MSKVSLKDKSILLEGVMGSPYNVLINDDGSFDFDSCTENLFHTNCSISVFLEDEDDNKTNIGEITLDYIDLDLGEIYGWDAFSILDMEDGDTCGIYGCIYDKNGENWEDTNIWSNNIIYLRDIYLEKKYRNLGIGKQLLTELPSIIRNLFKIDFNCIVLYPRPFEKINGKKVYLDELDNYDNNELVKLQNFYEKCGFNKSQHGNKNYYIKLKYDE